MVLAVLWSRYGFASVHGRSLSLPSRCCSLPMVLFGHLLLLLVSSPLHSELGVLIIRPIPSTQFISAIQLNLSYLFTCICSGRWPYICRYTLHQQTVSRCILSSVHGMRRNYPRSITGCRTVSYQTCVLP